MLASQRSALQHFMIILRTHYLYNLANTKRPSSFSEEQNDVFEGLVGDFVDTVDTLRSGRWVLP